MVSSKLLAYMDISYFLNYLIHVLDDKRIVLEYVWTQYRPNAQIQKYTFAKS